MVCALSLRVESGAAGSKKGWRERHTNALARTLPPPAHRRTTPRAIPAMGDRAQRPASPRARRGCVKKQGGDGGLRRPSRRRGVCRHHPPFPPPTLFALQADTRMCALLGPLLARVPSCRGSRGGRLPSWLQAGRRKREESERQGDRGHGACAFLAGSGQRWGGTLRAVGSVGLRAQIGWGVRRVAGLARVARSCVRVCFFANGQTPSERE